MIAMNVNTLVLQPIWDAIDIATALAAVKLHDEAPTKKKLKARLEAEAPQALAALSSTWKASLGSDDGKFTKALESIVEDAFDRVAFARACFALSGGHLGYAFRMARRGDVARQALEDDLDETGRLLIAKVKVLPPELDQVRGLRTLALWKMPGFKALPASVGALSTLQGLEVSSTPLATFGDVLAQHQTLREIRCDAVPLQRIGVLPATLGSLQAFGAVLAPPEAFCLPSLHTLGLTYDDATPLPSAVGEVPQLRSLAFRPASSLPNALWTCEHLERLDLSGYVGDALPEGLGRLTRLKSLHLRGAKALSALPEALAALPALEELDLVFCQNLEGPPPWLSRCASLKRLRIQYTPWEQHQQAIQAALPRVTIFK